MSSPDPPRRENAIAGDRISKLIAASLRVSASLDLDTVLREVMDSARALTGARYGAITTIDASGRREAVIASGFAPDEHCHMMDWGSGPQVFEHFRNLEGALRVKDLPGFVRSLGLPPGPAMPQTAQGTAMRHRGVHVGNFFLAGKAGEQEFTSEDEEVLLLFAAQAATAIVNARAFRDERRARTDLEAVVDTSPVGVAVLDAGTGRPVLLNGEARRMVERLVAPGHEAERLLEVLKVRLADGREVLLKEPPLKEVLRGARTVRAEEVVLKGPDGRSVTTLINLTPIHSENGGIKSVVVTLQDLAPLEALERSRAEFLSLVSHELRAPLAAIKGSAATVLNAAPAPQLAEILQFFRIIDQQADDMRGLISNLLDAGSIEAGTLSVAPEPVEVAELVDQARSNFLSGGHRHSLLIDLPPNLPRVLADRDRIVQVLNNLFSNASRHSPETLPLRLSAVQDGVHVAVSVSDEGQGIPPEQLPHLFRKHARVGNDQGGIRGSGLGLAICKGLVEAHGGRIRAESPGAGQGARFTFTIPVAEDAERSATAGLARKSSRPPRQDRQGTRILVVDDDPLTLRFVRDALSAAGYSTLVTANPRDLPHLIRTEKPHLVLLDLVLPGTDGISLMEKLPELADLPVIFISAYGRDETIADALHKGAADYIVKPFSATELQARVHAALRKVTGPSEPFRLGDLAIDYEARQVTMAGKPLELTATEFDLLRVLSINAGRVITYDSLLRRVWGDREAGDFPLLQNYVKRLRRKLGDDATHPAYIFTLRQVGYRMARPSDP